MRARHDGGSPACLALPPHHSSSARSAEFEGFSSDETVMAKVSGNQEPRGCDITEAAVEQGPERLSVLVQEAYKAAHARSTTAMKQRMAQLAQQMGLPMGVMPQ